jgi:glycosyltransferase involved in cell wall biosynthesis
LTKDIVIIGPAYPLRGGLSAFDERLATELQLEGHSVTIYNFSLQYPGFLFPGKTQYSNEPAPQHLHILQKINSVNPLNWIRVGNELKKRKPDLIIVRFWLPFMAPAFGTILRRVKKNRHTRVVAITDNIIPHEKRPGDKPLARYFLKSCDAFITMSEKVMNDLRLFEKEKPAILAAHPLYDNFGPPVSKAAARAALQVDMDADVLLFFGFIRKYKGLDILLDSIKIIKLTKPDLYQRLKLIIAGEFYEDSGTYRQKIAELGIGDRLILHTDFIPTSEVKNYFCAADAVVQPYRSDTQSGVTPLAYHFNKPMIVTNVGALPDYVPNEKAGLVTAPVAAALATTIARYFTLGEDFFIPHLREEKKKYSWKLLADKIIGLAGNGTGKKE